MFSDTVINIDQTEETLPLLNSSQSNGRTKLSRREKIVISVAVLSSLILAGVLLVATYHSGMADPKVKDFTLVLILVTKIATQFVLPNFALIYLIYLKRGRNYWIRSSSSNSETSELLEPPVSTRNSFLAYQSDDEVNYDHQQTFLFDSKRYNILILTIVGILGLIISVLTDIAKFSFDSINKTMWSDIWVSIRGICRMLLYIGNCIPILLAFLCAMNTYKNIIHKSDEIRYLFLGSRTQNVVGIRELRDWSYKVHVLNIGSKERKELHYTNIWATSTVVCYIIWFVTYSLYVLSANDYERWDLYLKALGFSLLCMSLMISPWITNNIIDNMKETIMIIQDKSETFITDINFLKSSIKNCKPYALLFTAKPSIPALLLQIVAMIAPFIITYVRTSLNI